MTQEHEPQRGSLQGVATPQDSPAEQSEAAYMRERHELSQERLRLLRAQKERIAGLKLTEPCKACDGSGHATFGNQVRTSEKCPACDGSGRRMSTLIIEGHSDDVVSLSGSINDEIGYYEHDQMFLALSDGSVFSITYNGCWRIAPVILPAGCEWVIESCSGDPDDDPYSDKLTVENVNWVVASTGIIR